MQIFKKNVNITLFQPLKKPKFLFWAFLAVAIVCMLAGIFAPSKVALWVIAILCIILCLAIKLICFNHIRSISSEECIHFFGKQGSGKSFFMAREGAYLKKKQNLKIAVNTTFDHYTQADFVCTRSDLGHKDLRPGTMLLWDEGNLDGFDNRNSAQNFKDNSTLNFWLKHRQNSNPVMITSQGFKSLDKKIREDCVTSYYFCRNYGIFVVAQKLSLDMQLDPITSEPIEFYSAASPIEAIFRSDSWLIGIPKLQAKGLYKTCNRSHFDKGSF